MTSHNLSSKDMRDILGVVGTALEIKEADEQVGVVLLNLERIFKTGCNNFFFARPNKPTLNFKRAVSRGIEEKYILNFGDHYHKLDPYYKVSFSKTSPGVLVTDHFRNNPKSNEYYNEFMKPQAIRHQMSLYLRSNQHFLGVLSLFRPENARKFSSLEQAKATYLAPYLAGALEKALYLEYQTEQKDIIESIASQLPYDGVMIMDKSLDAVYQNESAEKIISQFTQDASRAGNLSQPLPDEIFRKCKDLLEDSQSEDNFKMNNQAFNYRTPGGKGTLNIHWRLIGSREEGPLILLGFNRDNQPANVSGILRKQGLTNREIEIVSLISKGLKNREIGEELFISEYTVENHLRAIYRKMRVKNRTEVTHRLLQIYLRKN